MDGTNSNAIVFIKTSRGFDDIVNIITGFPSTKNVLEHIILLVVGIIIFLSSVFLNSVVITAILGSSQLKAKVSCFTILVRSAMDLAFALVIFPFFITLLSKEIGLGKLNCNVIFTTKKRGILFLGYSVTIMCMMNVERYMGILHPLTHRAKVTKTRLLKSTILGLAIQTIIFAPSIIDNQITPFIVAATTFLLTAITVFVYARIWFSQQHLRNVRLGRQLSAQSHFPVVTRNGRLMKEIKLARSSFMIVICFLICFLPATISNIEMLRMQPSFSLVVHERLFSLLAISSTTLNSIIFFCTNRALRKSGIKSIKRTVLSR